MMVVHEVRSGGDIEAIHKGKNYSLADFVWKYVDQNISYAANKTYAEKKHIKQAIEILALVSPLAKPEIEAISEWVELDEAQLGELLTILEEGGLLEIIHKETKLFFWRDENGNRMLQRGEFLSFLELPDGWERPEVREEDLIYNFRPDPFRDILIKGLAKQKKKLRAIFSSKMGMLHFEVLFQNLLNVLQIHSGNERELIELFSIFSENLKNHTCPPEFLEQLINKSDRYGELIKGFGLAVFEQIIELLNTEGHPLNQSIYGTKKDQGIYHTFRDQIHRIFERQILQGKAIDDQSFDLIFRFCMVSQTNGLLLFCSQAPFVPYKGADYTNARFIQRKVEREYLQEEDSVEFGLKYLGGSMGIYCEGEFQGFESAAPFRSFDHGMIIQVLTNYRKEVLQKLIQNSVGSIDHRWLIVGMFLSHVKRWGGLLFSHGEYYGLDKEGFERDITHELKVVFNYLIDFAKDNRDLRLKIDFVHLANRTFVGYDPLINQMYQQLMDILLSSERPGEGIALEFFMPSQDDSIHWAKIDNYLKEIGSGEQLVEELIYGYEVYTKLGKSEEVKKYKRWNASWRQVFWRVLEADKFSLPDFYRSLFETAQDLIWESRGELLAGMRFSDNPDLEVFFETIEFLLKSPTIQTTEEILNAYFPSSRFEVWNLWEERDKVVIDRILDMIPEINTDKYSPTISFYVILASFVRYDANWTLSRFERCFEVFDPPKIDMALHHLFDQDEKHQGAVPFFKDMVKEHGHHLDFFWGGPDTERILRKTYPSLSPDQLKELFIRFFKRRFAQGAPPFDIHATLLKKNTKETIVWPETPSKQVQYQRFSGTLDWYLALDFDTVNIFIDDAWQFLRYFKPENWEAQIINKMLKAAETRIENNPKAMFNLFTVHYLFEDRMQSSDISKRLSDFLATMGYPAPEKEEIPEDYKDNTSLKSVTQYLQIKDAYPRIYSGIPYSQPRVGRFFMELCGMLF